MRLLCHILSTHAHTDLGNPTEAKEAEALRHLEKTLTNLNKNKDGNKTALADPRGLPKRPRDTAYTTSHSGSDRHFSPPKDTPMQKVRKAAGQVVNSRQLAIKARHTPQQALSTVPKGLSEAMRIRRQPMIPMRSDKRPENADPERTELEHHGRRMREAKLLAAQKPKAPAKGDDTHMPGTNTPNSLQTAMDASRKPATAATPSAPPRAASPPNLASGLVKTSSNNILSRPLGVQKAHSRFKVVTSPAPPSVSSSNSPNDLNATPTSSRRLSVPAWSPSAATSLDTDSEDDECREKETSTKPMQLAPGSPTKRPFSMMEGESSESASSTALVSSTGLPPRKRIKKVPGIFMPAKRAR